MAESPVAIRRVAVFILLVLITALLVRTSTVGDSFTPEAIRAQAQDAGLLGLILFIATFTVGLLAYVPGTVFIVAAAYVYGWPMGFFVALGSALVAVSINFLLARRIVGTPLKQISHPRMKQLLDHLDRYPVRNVILLRTIFNANAVLNHALALSTLRFRDYVLGSALGMILPMIFITALVGTIF